MAIAKLMRPDDEGAVYHGIEVLGMHVDDPIPTPRAPERYAVRITPDLARYFLTFNHPHNRTLRPRKVTQMARDMAANRWYFTPESIVFSNTGVLQNGQNRLMAVTEFGGPVWMAVDFGWPDEIIAVIDRAAARTNQDAMKIAGQPSTAQLAGVVSQVWRYDRTVGTSRTWSAFPIPSAAEAIELTREHEGYADAVREGARVYRGLDHGGSASGWGAAFYLIAREQPARWREFVDEIADGTGASGSATRVVADWFRRRPVTASKTGDSREPLELIIRAFNDWAGGRRFGFVKAKGFPLTRVRSA